MRFYPPLDNLSDPTRPERNGNWGPWVPVASLTTLTANSTIITSEPPTAVNSVAKIYINLLVLYLSVIMVKCIMTDKCCAIS